MKRILKITSVFLLLLLFSVIAISCGDDTDYTEFETIGLSYQGGEYKVTVSSDVATFNLGEKFKILDKAKLHVSKSKDFGSTIDKVVSLENGDNIFFVRISDDNDHSVIKRVNIHRNHLYNVVFDTNGGQQIPSMTIEEGNSLENKIPLKLGYAFTGWTVDGVNFDFTKKVTSDLTLVAQWTPSNYNIIIDADNTTEDDRVIPVSYDSNFVLPIPEKEGYTFNSWLLNGATFDPTQKYRYTNDITIVAKFTPKEYTINYVFELGASNPNTIQKFTIESVISLSDALWKDDEKRFIGWFDSQDENAERITEISNRAESITLYARFEEVIFTPNVSLIVNGVVYKTVSVTYKRPYSITDVPELDELHYFDGWLYNGEKIDVSGAYWSYKTDISLVANVIAKEYDIDYVIGDGAINDKKNPTSFTADDEDFVLIAPTNGNHLFEGWYLSQDFSEESKIELITPELAGKKLTLYAKWQHRSLVTFNANGGDVEKENDLFSYNKEFTLPVVTRDNYVFTGWYYGDLNLNDVDVWTYKTDVEIVAHWKPISYSITYILNGENVTNENVESYNVESGIITLKNPTWENNIKLFAGWYLENAFENKVEEIDSANNPGGIVLYAKWNDIEVNVSFDANGGQFSMEGTTVIFGDKYSFTEPIRLGYNFVGWYLDDDLINLSDVWMTNQESVTLVAKWDPIKYKIDYDLDGGSYDGLVTEYTIATSDFTLPVPTKEGHTFIGWINRDGALSSTVTIQAGSYGDKSYTAKWFKTKDDKGLIYELRESVMVVVGFDPVINWSLDYFPDVEIPSEYYGYPVTTIGTRAFESFGKVFVNTPYAEGHAERSFTKIYLPTSIELVGAYAFEGCYGIKVQYYSTTDENLDYKAWDKTVTYEAGNLPARDCIWGFRPALGWSRYSKAEIPEDY